MITRKNIVDRFLNMFFFKLNKINTVKKSSKSGNTYLEMKDNYYDEKDSKNSKLTTAEKEEQEQILADF